MLKSFARLIALVLFLSFSLVTSGFAQSQSGASNQQNSSQQVPPLTDQSSYPKETHKVSPAEKRRAATGAPVDLNTATKIQLAALPGVGPDYAQTIIDARPFTSKEDLLRKKVVPQSTFDKIKDHVSADGPKKQSTKPSAGIHR
jgi:competence protein ComEA